MFKDAISNLYKFLPLRRNSRTLQVQRKLDLTDTIKDGARLFFTDEGIRRQLLLALTEDSKLHIEEVYLYYVYNNLWESCKCYCMETSGIINLCSE